MFKKIIALCLSALLLCSISTTAFGTDTPISTVPTFEEAIPKEVQERMAAQTPALEAYFELMEFFEKDEFGVPIYPDHYAGEYIDENNKLVVQFTEKFSDKKVLSHIASSPIIQTKQVEHSYNELAAQKKVADALIFSGSRVVSHGVDIVNNKYEIELLKDDLSKASTTYAKNSLISFKEGEPAQAMAQLKGGNGIYSENTGSTSSIGICGTYQGEDAFLTCGHGHLYEDLGDYLNPPMYIKRSQQGSYIGEIVYHRANTVYNATGTNTSGDFAIVEITSSDTITNDIMYNNTQITGTLVSAPVGTLLYKYGDATGYSYGTVRGIGLYVQYYVDLLKNGSLYTVYYYVNGLHRLDMEDPDPSDNKEAVGPGDSGGPVWRSNNGQNLIFGIVTAKNEASTIMYTTPIRYAQNQGFQPKLN